MYANETQDNDNSAGPQDREYEAIDDPPPPGQGDEIYLVIRSNPNDLLSFGRSHELVIPVGLSGSISFRDRGRLIAER